MKRQLILSILFRIEFNLTGIVHDLTSLRKANKLRSNQENSEMKSALYKNSYSNEKKAVSLKKRTTHVPIQITEDPEHQPVIETTKEDDKQKKFSSVFISNTKEKVFFLLGTIFIVVKGTGYFITIGSAALMFLLGVVCDLVPFIEPIYTFFLPIYSTLAIFQFITKYLKTLVDCLISFMKGEAIYSKVHVLGISMIIVIPLLLGLLFSEKRRMVKSKYHSIFFLLASVYIALNFDSFSYITSSLTALSNNTETGYIAGIMCYMSSGILKAVSGLFNGSLAIIFRFLSFYFSNELLNEIYLTQLNFSTKKTTKNTKEKGFLRRIFY